MNEAFSSKTKVSFFHLILWAFEIKNKKGKKKLHIRFAFRAPFKIKFIKFVLFFGFILFVLFFSFYSFRFSLILFIKKDWSIYKSHNNCIFLNSILIYKFNLTFN
jgi:hypothetical protein